MVSIMKILLKEDISELNFVNGCAFSPQLYLYHVPFFIYLCLQTLDRTINRPGFFSIACFRKGYKHVAHMFSMDLNFLYTINIPCLPSAVSNLYNFLKFL